MGGKCWREEDASERRPYRDPDLTSRLYPACGRLGGAPGSVPASGMVLNFLPRAPILESYMTSRDYTKEIGVRNDAAKIPLPYALALIAGVLAVAGFGLAAIHGSEANDAPEVVATTQVKAGGR